jgi:hypothetical protein
LHLAGLIIEKLDLPCSLNNYFELLIAPGGSAMGVLIKEFLTLTTTGCSSWRMAFVLLVNDCILAAESK